MKSLSSAIQRIAWFLTAITLLPAAAAIAQVESLNPNPMLPAGVGSAGDLEEYRSGRTEGTRIGQEIGGRVDGTDRNPADVMLRELNGTNNGRRTGRAAIRGGAVRAALRVERLRGIPPVADGAVYFGRRGDYENAIYVPHRGSYHFPAPHRNSITRTTNQR